MERGRLESLKGGGVAGLACNNKSTLGFGYACTSGRSLRDAEWKDHSR